MPFMHKSSFRFIFPGIPGQLCSSLIKLFLGFSLNSNESNYNHCNVFFSFSLQRVVFLSESQPCRGPSKLTTFVDVALFDILTWGTSLPIPVILKLKSFLIMPKIEQAADISSLILQYQSVATDDKQVEEVLCKASPKGGLYCPLVASGYDKFKYCLESPRVPF